MKISIGDLRQIIREALDSEQLALYTWSNSPSSIKVLLYSPVELLSLDWSDRYELPKDVVKGYAAFHRPDEQCRGAWEVTAIAGIGYGKILYGLGYSLTPNNMLMPDRAFSSKKATDAWTKSSEKMTGFPLDYVDAEESEKITSDDPSDDCEVRSWKIDPETGKGSGDPVLDMAYKGPHTNPGPMMKVHDNTVTELMEILNGLGAMYADPEEVDEMLGGMLKSVSTKYFSSEFQKYYKER